MKKICFLIGLLLVVGLLPPLASADTNVALGKSVSLNGTFFTDAGGWGAGVVSPPGRIVNGVFAPEMYVWNMDGVWWNGSLYPSNNIVIDLGGTYTINSFIVQADDNDTFRVSYFGLDSNWHDAYNVPTKPSYGLVTRDEYFLAAPISASALKFVATGGDGYYSVSQIVANGCGASSVPEPATMILLGLGLIGLSGIRRKYHK